MLADLLIAAAAAQPRLAALQAVARWLPRAQRRLLTPTDLARIDAYTGDGQALHEMLAAVLPLAAPVWYEATITAQRGTRMTLGYGATQAGPGELDVWYAAHAAGRIIGPLGPLRMDGQSLAAGADDATARELRAAAGIVVRAMLMRCGEAT